MSTKPTYEELEQKIAALQKEVIKTKQNEKALFETMAQGVVYQDAEGKIISANPSAERIIGLTLDQMQGKTSVDPTWKAIREDGSDFTGETHPSMIALKTGQEIKDAVMGVFNPRAEGYRWININAIPQFEKGEYWKISYPDTWNCWRHRQPFTNAMVTTLMASFPPDGAECWIRPLENYVIPMTTPKRWRAGNGSATSVAVRMSPCAQSIR